MAQTFNSFDEFWPYYLRAHSSPATRGFHYAGNAAALIVSIGGLVFYNHLGALMIGIGFGYLLAWIGHFFFEKNRPATFGNPLWSLMGDVRMFGLWLSGRLAPELKRFGISED